MASVAAVIDIQLYNYNVMIYVSRDKTFLIDIRLIIELPWKQTLM